MKVKGFILLELIISIFFLSILSLGIYKSYITIQNLHNVNSIKEEIYEVVSNATESKILGQDYINDKFEIEIYESEYNGYLNKIEVIVYSEEINYEEKLITYYQKKN